MKRWSPYLKTLATVLGLLSLVLFSLQGIFPHRLVGTGVAPLLPLMMAIAAAIGFAHAYADKPTTAAFCAGVATAAFALGEIVNDVGLMALFKGGDDFPLKEGGGFLTVSSLILGLSAASAAFWMARRLERST